MKRTAQRSVSDFCFIPHPSSLIPPHMTPADKLAAEEARRQFALEVSQEAGAIDVARAALLIAAEEEPGRCDVARCLGRLDELGADEAAKIDSWHVINGVLPAARHRPAPPFTRGRLEWE